MGNKIKPNTLAGETWHDAQIVNGTKPVDPMWGLNLIQITEEGMEALKNGKYAYFHDDEYAHLMRMKREKGAGNG